MSRPANMITLLSAFSISLIFATTSQFAGAQVPQFPGGPGGFGAQFGGGKGDVSISAEFMPASDDRPAVLFVTADVDRGFHIYSLDQPKTADGFGPQETTITVAESDEYQLAAPFQPITPPDVHLDDLWEGLEMREHEGRVTWFAPIEIAEDVDPATLSIAGSVEGQACSTVCIPFNHDFAAKQGQGVELPAGADLSAKPLGGNATPVVDSSEQPSQPQDVEQKSQTPVTAGSNDSLPSNADASQPDNQLEQSDSEDRSFLYYLMLAFAGGIILNVMPCVLPVIGLKVFAFIEQAGESRGKIFLLNLWYSLGVISVFMILAVLSIVFQLGWGQLFQYAEFNIAMAAVIFTMGLSFLGVWEIPIPGFIGTSKVTEIGQREGYEGAFAKGTITTLLATPCTGPFMGTALVGVLTRPPHEILLLFFAIGLGMASPYLLIGAFPKLVEFLPKPGEWMNTFKQFMGFVLIGTVLYLLTLLKPHYVVPTVTFLFGLGLTCWWIGRVPATADGSRRWQALGEGALPGIVAGLIAFYGLAPVLASRQSREANRLAEIKLEQLLDATGGEFVVTDEPWQPYTERKLQWLLDRGKTVLIDFTADWCPNCKLMEKTVLKTDVMSAVYEKHDIYTLVADWTHRDTSTEVTAKLAELGTRQIPLLAIYSASRPNEPILVPGTYTASSLTAKLDMAGPSSPVSLESTTARSQISTSSNVPAKVHQN